MRHCLLGTLVIAMLASAAAADVTVPNMDIEVYEGEVGGIETYAVFVFNDDLPDAYVSFANEFYFDSGTWDEMPNYADTDKTFIFNENFVAPVFSYGTALPNQDVPGETASLWQYGAQGDIYFIGGLANPVPEPATMGLLAFGAVGLLRRRRR
jgi:opacity protein-like surface antigen